MRATLTSWKVWHGSLQWPERTALNIALMFGLATLAGITAQAFLLFDRFFVVFLCILGTPFACVFLMVAIVKALVRRRLRAAAPLLLLAILAVPSWLPIMRLGWALEKLAWQRVAARGDKIVRAIRSFEHDHSVPPASLTALVPKYLESIPTTGAPAHPAFKYEVFKDANDLTLLWFDLGSREGRPMSGLWVLPDGPESHAILGLTVAPNGYVVDSRIDRAPAHVDARAFDPETWRSDTNARMAMVRQLPSGLLREHRRQILETLGPPDGQRVIPSSRWELRVPCSQGGLNWDVFFYWPSETYPELAYGGSIERIGRWAYVHE